MQWLELPLLMQSSAGTNNVSDIGYSEDAFCALHPSFLAITLKIYHEIFSKFPNTLVTARLIFDAK
jgi:hypothetical protein